MDSEILSTAPREMAVGGKLYPIGKLALKEWDALTAYLKDHAADPFVAGWQNFNRLKASGIPVSDEDRKAFFVSLNQQAKHWPPPVGSSAWFDLVMETEGAAQRFFSAVLRKHNPALTDGEITSIVGAMTDEESVTLTCRALGFPDPKTGEPGAETAPAQPKTTTG